MHGGFHLNAIQGTGEADDDVLREASGETAPLATAHAYPASNKTVSGSRRQTRVFLALIVAAGFALAAMPAMASRIRPDIKKVLDSQQPIPQLPPARAGWNGPEVEPPSANAAAAELHEQRRTSEVRASLLQAAMPDLWAVLGIAAAILLLRVLRQRGLATRAEVVSMEKYRNLRKRLAA